MNAMLRLSGAVMLAALALVALQRLCVAPYHCNAVQSSAEMMLARLDASPDSMETVAQARAVGDRVGICLKQEPHNVNLLMEHAASDLLLGRREEALSHYEEALRYDRRPEIYLAMGQLQYKLGRTQEAVRTLGRTYAFATYLINYDLSLPWSGERTVDQTPPALEPQILAEAERVKRELSR